MKKILCSIEEASKGGAEYILRSKSFVNANVLSKGKETNSLKPCVLIQSSNGMQGRIMVTTLYNACCEAGIDAVSKSESHYEYDQDIKFDLTCDKDGNLSMVEPATKKTKPLGGKKKKEKA
jgi:hypothetical protein